ncbi:MAG: ABC transporter permease [Bacteroidales bacterium]|nr:ABC transporter permease [Bacteroidales bacterium]
MNVSLFIALRYLFARKSHNVINVISAISAAGIAIGTAALILILSVYNGFDRIIKDNLSALDPDLLLVPDNPSGRFTPDPAELGALEADEAVKSISLTLQDNVFAVYGDKQAIVRAKGIENADEAAARLEGHVIDGSFRLVRGDSPAAVLGSGLAHRLGARPCFLDPLILYYPEREGKISMSDPLSSTRSAKLFPSAVIGAGGSADDNLVILPLDVLQRLTGCETGEISGVEICLNDASRRSVRRFKAAHPEYRLLDRVEQEPTLYRMMKFEKAAIFMILMFIVLIVALNVFGCLSMLTIEKQDDTATLSALGASPGMLKRIFILEGWLISLTGLAIGIIAGAGLAALQQHTGLVKMPGGFLVSAYPVALQAGDVLLTAVGVALTGLAIAVLSVRRILR